MEESFVFEGGDIAHWSITELYPEIEEELRSLLESGDDFDTGVGECKHSTETLRMNYPV